MILIGNKLRKLRNDGRFKQKQLGEMVGVSSTQISNYENNLRRPSYEVLIRYARIFHVTTDYLLGIEKPDFANMSGLGYREKEILIQLIELLKIKNIR